jgi:cyanophycinase
VDVFLIGGGRDEAAVLASHRSFAAAVSARGAPPVAFLLDEGDDTDPGRWTAALATAGAPGARTVVVSPARPPAPADLDGAGGVFVAGGWTPGYQEAFAAAGERWLQALRAAGLPYAGFSAGAAIAPTRAIVGGWRVARNGGEPLAVCAEEAGEDLELVQPRPGLGLVPFAVDVHATQWGTLTRLVHAVASGLVAEGVAIDEGTCVEARAGADAGELRVHGTGSAYRVQRGAGGATVTPLQSGHRPMTMGPQDGTARAAGRTRPPSMPQLFAPPTPAACPSAPTAPRPGRPRACRPALGPPACRADTTPRRARPGSPTPPP